MISVLTSLAMVIALQAAPELDEPIQLDGPIELSSSQPDEEAPRQYASPQERLTERLAQLAQTSDEERAAILASEVQSLWRQQAGATADLLLQRATTALEAGDNATAERAYSHLRNLEPEFAEGWIASARLAMAQADWAFALEALNTAVTLEPRRFDAWAMLGQTLERADAPQAALAAYEEALALYPLHPQAGSARAELERELVGRAL